MNLAIETIPQDTWGQSLAHLLPKPVWDSLRREVYQYYKHTCAVCSATGEMHCHEVWEFDDTRHTQKLVGLIALCKMCHDTVHYLHTSHEVANGHISRKYLQEIEQHFCRINKCEYETFLTCKAMAIKESLQRREHKWTIYWGRWKPSNVNRMYAGLAKGWRKNLK